MGNAKFHRFHRWPFIFNPLGVGTRVLNLPENGFEVLVFRRKTKTSKRIFSPEKRVQRI